MPFDKNSYLGDQIKLIRDENITKNKKENIIMNELNRDLNSLIYNFKHTENINNDYFILGLTCKVIQTYNSIVILLNLGLESDSKTLLRTLIESIFNLRAIIYDENYFDKYLRKGDNQSLELIKSIRKNTDVFNKEIIDKITEEKISELQEIIKPLKNKKEFTYDLACSARMRETYLYTYNLLSLEAHSNAKAIISNYFIDSDGNRTLSLLPRYDNYDYIFVTLISVMYDLFEGLNEYFDCDLNPYLTKYKEILIKHISEI